MRFALALILAASPAYAQSMRPEQISQLVGVGLECGHPMNSDNVLSLLMDGMKPDDAGLALGFDMQVSYGRSMVTNADALEREVICAAALVNLGHLGLLE
jgi:hypothetical protein